MIKYLFVLGIFFMTGSSHAGPFAISLANKPFPAGSEVEFKLVSISKLPDKDIQLPGEISCRLEGQNQCVKVKARAKHAGTPPLDSFLYSQSYSFQLPTHLKGQVIMSLTEIEAPKVALELQPPEEGPQTRDRDGSDYPSYDSLFALYQPYLMNVGPYEPMYFLVGTNPEQSKFQLSFKYRFFNPETSFARSSPFLQGLHFGYTQTSFWDLASDSAPFSDTSYKPELFWISPNIFDGKKSMLKGLFLQTGIEHESNGRGGEFSRSTNYLYVKPITMFFDSANGYGLELSSKIWTYFENDDETNPDLSDYRGYFDIETKFSKSDSYVIRSLFRWAEQGTSVQFDVSYPLHRLFPQNLDIYLYFQYVNMLAEGLLDYEDRTEAFRIGLSIIR